MDPINEQQQREPRAGGERAESERGATHSERDVPQRGINDGEVERGALCLELGDGGVDAASRDDRGGGEGEGVSACPEQSKQKEKR